MVAALQNKGHGKLIYANELGSTYFATNVADPGAFAIDGAAKGGKGAYLIYQESSLVIRAIRDYFTQDIGEILIDTDDIYEQAKQFMLHVMPDNAQRVKRYRDDAPLFSRFQIEHQIETAFSRTVNLPSGGAIVIDHTEALVSVDVNSARAIKGGDIEETAAAFALAFSRKDGPTLLALLDSVELPDNRKLLCDALVFGAEAATDPDKALARLGGAPVVLRDFSSVSLQLMADKYNPASDHAVYTVVMNKLPTGWQIDSETIQTVVGGAMFGLFRGAGRVKPIPKKKFQAMPAPKSPKLTPVDCAMKAFVQLGWFPRLFAVQRTALPTAAGALGRLSPGGLVIVDAPVSEIPADPKAAAATLLGAAKDRGVLVVSDSEPFVATLQASGAKVLDCANGEFVARAQ